jgi:hypothetical protein
MGIPNSDESTQSSNMETVINNRNCVNSCVSESRQTANQTVDDSTNDDSQRNNGKYVFDNFKFIFIEAIIFLKIHKLFQIFLYFKTFSNFPYFKTFELRNSSNIA